MKSLFANTDKAVSKKNFIVFYYVLSYDYLIKTTQGQFGWYYLECYKNLQINSSYTQL